MLPLEVLLNRLEKLHELSPHINVQNAHQLLGPLDILVTEVTMLCPVSNEFVPLGSILFSVDARSITYALQIRFPLASAGNTKSHNEAMNELNSEAGIMTKFALDYDEIVCSCAIPVVLLYPILGLDGEEPLAELILLLVQEAVYGMNQITEIPQEAVTLH